MISATDELHPERIGARLRLFREAHGLRPAQLSDALGIKRVYWSRFEGGKRPITVETAALLVQRYGLTLDFIYLGVWSALPFALGEKLRLQLAQPDKIKAVRRSAQPQTPQDDAGS